MPKAKVSTLRRNKRMSKHARSKSAKDNISKRWNQMVSDENKIPADEPVNDPGNSASERKLNRTGITSQTLYSIPADAPENIIVNKNSLNELLVNICCPNCNQLSLIFDLHNRQGFAYTMQMVCSGCNFTAGSCNTSQRVQTVESTRPVFDVNRRIVSTMLDLGLGHAGLEQFSMHMNMATLSQPCYDAHVKMLHPSRVGVAEAVMQRSRQMVHDAYLELQKVPDSDGILDITVSFDGSWHKRGFTSNYGIAAVIDLQTGLVIDYVVMSKYCHVCEVTKSELGSDSAEYAIWFEGHKSSCSRNYSGSSGGMEVIAAEILFKRSISLCNMRYTTLLSDGDSKTHQHLQKLKVYGEHVLIEKEECVNHVAKRLGTALRELVKTTRAKNITLGGRGHGKLTDATITKLTNYYGHAIRSNSGSLHAMKTAIYATIFHAISTDDNPRHEKCPEGSMSWCFYNRAMATKEPPGSHVNKVRTPLSPDVLKHVMPIYQRLAADNLLSRCLGGHTQNPNESLHSVVWKKCPKSKFVSKYKVDIAVAGAVSEFNQGCWLTVLDCMNTAGLSPGRETANIATKRDMRRLTESKKAKQNKKKKLRLSKKLNKLRKEKNSMEKEGPTYLSGGF